MKHGQGLYVYANGDVYEGGYYNGVKHGFGTASWSNGSQYTGHWDSGREHGQGKYFTANGQCYTGTFNAGFVDGEGVHTWEDGSAFHCVHSMGAAVSQGHYIPGEETVARPQYTLPAQFAEPNWIPPTPFNANNFMGPTPITANNFAGAVAPLSTEGLVQMPNGQIGYMLPAQEFGTTAKLPTKMRSRSREHRDGTEKPRARSASAGRREGKSPAREIVPYRETLLVHPISAPVPYGPHTAYAQNSRAERRQV